jgi:hypothetical protein
MLLCRSLLTAGPIFQAFSDFATLSTCPKLRAGIFPGDPVSDIKLNERAKSRCAGRFFALRNPRRMDGRFEDKAVQWSAAEPAIMPLAGTRQTDSRQRYRFAENRRRPSSGADLRSVRK